MHIRLLYREDEPLYMPFILRGVSEHSRDFRISLQDVLESADPLSSDNPGDFTLGAFSPEGALLGVVSFAREHREKLHHKGVLHRMYVAVEATGKGVGRALIRALVQRAGTQAGLEQIMLTVLAHNTAAKRLYASEGFVALSTEAHALKVGQEYFDEEQMALYLRP